MASYLFELSYTVVVIGLVYTFLSSSYTYNDDWKKITKHWILFGFVINLYGLSWLYTVYPLPWMEKGLTQLGAIATLHLILSLAVAIPYGIIASSQHRKIPVELQPFAFASLLTLAEVARAYIISLLYYKQGESTLGLHFTAGTIGNALSTTPLIEFAYFGGTFALTFVLGYLIYIACFTVYIATYWKHILGVIVILLYIHFQVPITLPNHPVSVGIITTNTTIPDKPENYGEVFKEQEQRIHTLTLSFASTSNTLPAFIVYPEDTRYISSLTPTHKTDLLITYGKTVFVDGDTLTTSNGFSNVSLLYVPSQQNVLVRGKQFLLPFNEYIPSFFSKLFSLFITKENMDHYTSLHTYKPKYSPMVVPFDDVRIGTLICSEILSHTTVKKLMKEKPNIIFFQSHLQVFQGSLWFDMHLRSFTKIAAAQMRTTIISSTSDAPSYTVSPYGTIELTLPAGEGASIYLVDGK